MRAVEQFVEQLRQRQQLWKQLFVEQQRQRVEQWWGRWGMIGVAAIGGVLVGVGIVLAAVRESEGSWIVVSVFGAILVVAAAIRSGSL